MKRTSRQKNYGLLRQTPAQRNAQRESQRERTDYTRWKCNWLKVWRLCPRIRCRRHRTCSGEPHACWELHWNAMPEDFKNRIRLSMQALGRGIPPQEVPRHVEAELARLTELQHRQIGPAPAKAAADDAAAPVAPAAPREPPGPRIRQL